MDNQIPYVILGSYGSFMEFCKDYEKQLTMEGYNNPAYIVGNNGDIYVYDVEEAQWVQLSMKGTNNCNFCNSELDEEFENISKAFIDVKDKAWEWLTNRWNDIKTLINTFKEGFNRIRNGITNWWHSSDEEIATKKNKDVKDVNTWDRITDKAGKAWNEGYFD